MCKGNKMSVGLEVLWLSKSWIFILAFLSVSNFFSLFPLFTQVVKNQDIVHYRNCLLNPLPMAQNYIYLLCVCGKKKFIFEWQTS